MIIRNMHPLSWWLTIGSILFVLAVGIPIGISIWYTHQEEQHACQALVLLTKTPVAKPTDPAENPSRETNYQFYEALLYWERADGC